MVLALVLGIAAALVVASAMGASRARRGSGLAESPRERGDHIEELMVLDIVSDGALDGDIDPIEDP